jgi:hypothetical protein
VDKRRWPAWQIIVLILVVVGAAIYVAVGVLEVGDSEPQLELGVLMSPTVTASPIVTAARPVIHTKTPTRAWANPYANRDAHAHTDANAYAHTHQYTDRRQSKAQGSRPPGECPVRYAGRH